MGNPGSRCRRKIRAGRNGHRGKDEGFTQDVSLKLHHARLCVFVCALKGERLTEKQTADVCV